MAAGAPDGYVAPDDRGRFALRKYIDSLVKFYSVRVAPGGTITLTPEDQPGSGV